MLYSFLHGLYYRLINKIYRVLKNKKWRTVPANKSSTFFNDAIQLFDPHLLGVNTLASEITSIQTTKEILNIYEKLDSELCIDFAKDFIKKGINNFGDNWYYADINSVLYAISKNLNIENYLEIGVRRGRSMCTVASQSPNISIYGFDMWIPNYTGSDNPGPDFVRSELSKFNYNGTLEFIDGDSKKTIPKFFKSNPNLYFDVVTVDGDHSIGGATRDLNNVMNRIKIGGILVFDDISSQEHPYLNKLWINIVKKKNNFVTWEYTDIGLGVAFAIRKF